MEKVLVTGSTGFIGRHTLPFLKAENFKVYAFTSNDKSKVDSAELYRPVIDIFDYDSVSEFCSEAQAENLLHLAWYDNHNDRMTSPLNMEWMGATLHLIREFVKNGGKRIVFAGSSAEYDWQYGYCSEHLTPTNPQSLYGECKSSVHKIIEKYALKKGVSYACGRIFFVYGPHESENRLVAYVIRSMLMNKDVGLSHCHQMRDYLHVEDVAEAMVKLLVSDVTGAVNIGSGRAVKLREIVNIVGEKLNAQQLIKYGPVESKFDSPVVFANTTRLINEVGWEPEYDLEKGLDNTIEWWKNKLNLKLDNKQVG